MMDLTKIDTPFGELDEATQGALLLARYYGEELECRGPSSRNWKTDIYHIDPHNVYRLTPKNVTQDTIPWEAIDPKFKWSARNSCGEIWVFDSAPICGRDRWTFGWLECVKISSLLRGVTPGTCCWRDSLQERPEGV